ncbi:MAG: hypothetical protein V7K20_22340 [Nostoc sp.]
MVSVTTAIALLFAGCGESKVAQCNKVIKVANQASTLGQEFAKNPNPAKGSKAFKVSNQTFGVFLVATGFPSGLKV